MFKCLSDLQKTSKRKEKKIGTEAIRKTEICSNSSKKKKELKGYIQTMETKTETKKANTQKRELGKHYKASREDNPQRSSKVSEDFLIQINSFRI